MKRSSALTHLVASRLYSSTFRAMEGFLTFNTRKNIRDLRRSRRACSFLGADGILVPSTRTPASNNLVIFCEQDTEIEKEIVRAHGALNFP